MNKKEKEIISLMKEWKDEIKKVIEDYQKQISLLNDAREQFEKQTKSKFQWIYSFAPYILMLLLFITSLIWLKFVACGTIKISGNEITVPCPTQQTK